MDSVAEQEKVLEYRARAREIKGQALDLKNSDARETLLRLADAYERMAYMIERHWDPQGLCQ